MPSKKEFRTAFQKTTKKAEDLGDTLSTTVCHTNQRSLIEESLDNEISFSVAAVKLTVDGTVSIELFDDHTLRADDSTKKDSDTILRREIEEDFDSTLGPRLLFHKGRS